MLELKLMVAVFVAAIAYFLHGEIKNSDRWNSFPKVLGGLRPKLAEFIKQVKDLIDSDEIKKSKI